ncbi:hypothetical protein [Chondromyces crocatus]|uniref:hypothetical protein n=1 Tax=Chondromyces crocatus TaxID=52 RepID=UPI0012E0E3C3|nr:hypothetical protein [Chondromyces crocatus]
MTHGPQGERRAVIYLHGRCGDPHAFHAWDQAVAQRATVISIQGDVPCEGSQRTTWSRSASGLDRRISRALTAVSAERGAPLDETSLTVVGYSLGASRAEDLTRAFPGRYPRAILVAGPVAPEVGSFTGGGAVVVVAGALDRRAHLQEGAAALIAAGVVASYLILPGAAHGAYGPEGERVMGEAFSWVFERVPSLARSP